ncbi:peptidyl-tRNA hydrolase domain protein [Aspergillus ibericus CBS 121593]|uniref:Peptidyl-tRNA hydrolase domain protein n=1 Tax=Aspergillus ibericus CBS 121593 TaxID=1448316 RepID=A0A395GXR1_9EURO|nr:peptidyl-tRNA hydrolase domain protein [Aspergillus ibericus CBS 121593]RAK99848.1 peptidyl-tRNA hydrolase domain protein [Aspergillus ibericus CBS 121593]
MAHVRLPPRNFHRVPLACSLPWSPTIAIRTFASRRAAAISNHQGLDSEEDLTAAREWVAKLNSKAITIPRDICEFSFSRSSGPGGQNVNKVNSKATLRVSLGSLLPLIPQVLHSPLLASRYVAARTQSLVIQSEESRRQTANLETCYDKLHQLLKSLAEDNIPGETSQEQRDRVQRLKKAANEVRIKSKKMHSSKKSSRRGSYDD